MSMNPIVLMLVKRCANTRGPDCSIDLTSFDYLLTNDGQWVSMESYLAWKGAIDRAEAVVLKGGSETCPSLEGGIYFPWARSYNGYDDSSTTQRLALLQGDCGQGRGDQAEVELP